MVGYITQGRTYTYMYESPSSTQACSSILHKATNTNGTMWSLNQTVLVIKYKYIILHSNHLPREKNRIVELMLKLLKEKFEVKLLSPENNIFLLAPFRVYVIQTLNRIQNYRNYWSISSPISEYTNVDR